MSSKDSSQKKDTQVRKRRKKSKSKSNSIVNNSEHNGGHCTGSGGGVSDVNKQTNKSGDNKNSSFSFPYPFTQPPVMNFSQQMPFPMQQSGGLTQSQAPVMPCMNPSLSPTQIPGSQQMFMPPTYTGSAPPSWLSDLINDVKQIKVSLEKLDKIERTVNSISLKVTTLETKVSSMETKVNQVEDSCTFISKENDDRKRELEKAKSEIKTLKSDCKSLETKNSKLETKVTDLESRSMRDNLLFYGIDEGGEHENCERLIKEVCINHLQMPEAKDMLIDRAHRVGAMKNNKPRPIVAKFHYYAQKEAVKSRSYERANELKQANKGIGMQWPQQVREARKALYPVMQQQKQNGKNVKLVRDKLYIDGTLYRPNAPQTQQQQNA